MSGFKTEPELKTYVLKQAKATRVSQLYKKGFIYIPQKCNRCHLWHNRDTNTCVPCENGEKPEVYENKNNFPFMKKRKEGWI